MSEIKISIVVPALNEEKLLPALIGSLEKQTYPRESFELIIVLDSRTTDNTEKIATDFGAKIVRPGQFGVARARYEGFKAATGAIIASTDADSEPYPNWLEVIAATFANHPEASGITGPTVFKDGNRFNRFLAGKPYDYFQRINIMIGLPSFPGFNFAVLKEAYQKTSGFNPTLKSSEDVDLSLKLSKVGKILFIPEMKVVTSSRRIETQGRWKFFGHHLRNYIKFTILRQTPGDFEAIR